VKAGDMVRFLVSGPYGPQNHWQLGLLVEYHKWEKIATVLHEGKLCRVPASRVTKAGKKDGDLIIENDSTITNSIGMA
jgi:hypothetical protein